MSMIYSTFSNPGGDLKALQHEFSGLFNFFNTQEIKQRVDFGFSLNATVEEITAEVIKHQKDIRLFHFSGHSGGSGMNFSGKDFASMHIARFFNTISADDSKIDCIVINGCENAGIVDRLSNIPIVIGTRSKIQDEVARQFTLNFFTSLIQAQSTYTQAYDDALSAIADDPTATTTRGEGGEELEEDGKLNEFFIRINDKAKANAKFPVKKAQRNWTKYLVIFFIIVALFLAYLFRSPVVKRVSGYSCNAIQTVDGKCNFVIGDFTTDQNTNINEWLFRNVREVDSLRRYLNAINIGSFNSIIYNNAIDRDSLPRHCGYDFNMTGDVSRSGDNQLRAEFNIFPYDKEGLTPGVFVYSVRSLPNLDTLISALDPNDANQFVLFRMCAACASVKGYPRILNTMENLVADYRYTDETAGSYQQMQYLMGDLAMDYGDTALALRSFERIGRAAHNDLSLLAIEKELDIHAIRNDIQKLYLAQSTYLKELEARETRTAGFVLEQKPEDYAKAANVVRLSRADLVLKYKDGALREYRPEAKKDYEHLDRIQYNGKRYNSNIQILQSNVHATPPNAVTSPGASNTLMLTHLQPSFLQVPSAVLVSYGILPADFRKLSERLQQEDAWKYDVQSSRITNAPWNGVSGERMVFYFDERQAASAEKLANFVSRTLNMRFNPKQVRKDDIPGTEHDLVIYWRK